MTEDGPVSTSSGGSGWAPIGLFIFKRPEHTRRMILSLLACDGIDRSPVHVFADGPRSSADKAMVEATRGVARELLGDRATFVERDHNVGLANSVIEGVTALCAQYGSVIVVEDDLVLAPSFLQFLNQGLRWYADESRVMQVSGHMFDVPAIAGTHEALLLPMTTSWGWATWSRSWALFDPAATGWQQRFADDAAARRFNLDGAYDHLGMLRRQMRGVGDSWAIRWYYAVFVHGGLVLFPPQTLVANTGFDGSGTHDRLALPARQAQLGSGGPLARPEELAESRHKGQVFGAVGAFRPSSRRRRLLGLTRAALRRAGLSSNPAKPVLTYVRLRRFERRFACRVHGEGEVQDNRPGGDSIVVGAGTHIRGQLFTFGHGGRIVMGTSCYVGVNTRIWSAASITIGNRVLIGHNSNIFDSDTHPMEASERHRHFVEITTEGWKSPFGLREEPVNIADDVWIGCNAVILKGVSIGRGSVVGAGSVVTHDVPPWVVVAGNPARVVRELPADER